MISNKALGACGVVFFSLFSLPAITSLIHVKNAFGTCRRLCDMSDFFALLWLALMLAGVFFSIRLAVKKSDDLGASSESDNRS